MILMLITEQASRKEAGEIFFIYYFCFKGSILIILVKRNFQNSFVLMERDSNTLSSKTQKISKKHFFSNFGMLFLIIYFTKKRDQKPNCSIWRYSVLDRAALALQAQQVSCKLELGTRIRIDFLLTLFYGVQSYR